MQSGGYGSRYRIKPRFYIIIIAALGLFVLVLLNLLGVFSEARVEWGRLSSDQSITAIVLRDETLVKATESSKLACIAAEGADVTKDAPVAMLYLTGYSEKDIANLNKLKNDIKDYQENNILKDIRNKDLTDINSKIDNMMGEISVKSISHQTQDLVAAELDLKTYMEQRKAFMLSIVHADDTLNLWYQQEATLQSKIDQTRKVINAQADGLVSYYLDGYESVLNVNGISDMTPVKVKELLNSMLKEMHPFKSNETVEKDQPVCRIVSTTKWYAVIVMNTRENPFVEGMQYDVTFDGLQNTVSTTVIKIATEGSNTLAVLEIHDGVKEMISMRLVNGHLGQDIEGFRVPLRMVLEENGRAYIAIQGTGANVKRVEVTVLGRDEKYAIIEDKTGEGNLAIGLPLVKP